MKHFDIPKLSYTVDETTFVIGCGRSKVYQLIGQGKLVARKIGSRTILTAESVQALARDGAPG